MSIATAPAPPLEIFAWSPQIAHIISMPVDPFDCAEVKSITDELFRCLHLYGGVGLAAPQVGIFKQIAVIHFIMGSDGLMYQTGKRAVNAPPDSLEVGPLVLINAEWTQVGTETDVHTEGCLSLPEIKCDVRRPTKIRLQFTDRDGDRHTQEIEGPLARAVQHELDHWQSKFIWDHVSSLKRDILKRQHAKRCRSMISKGQGKLVELPR